MPMLSIQTNAPAAKNTAAYHLEPLSERIAETLGKPESYVMVSLQLNENMLFGGSTDPLAYVELKSLGLPEDQTADLSRLIADSLNEWLEIPANRVYIEFSSGPRHMWGWDGHTF